MGVSESAFAARDAAMIYQYQAFGIPGLGLKRGLSEDVVVAPYATVLALPLEPHAALQNLDTLARQGAEGQYGFYEAVDYTPGRVPAGKRRAIVRCYMAHHQGMSMVSLGNVLTGRRMQERFHSDSVMHSAELLLQERVPRRAHIAQPHVEEVEFVRSVRRTPAGGHALIPHAPHAGARHSLPVERLLLRDGHQRGRRILPLAWPDGHTLPRGHHSRLLGHVLLPEGPRYRARMVSHLSTGPG